MKFLFINPPNRKLRNEVDKAVLPLGLAYLSSVLLQDNHEVKIIDSVIEDITNYFSFRNNEYYGLGLEKIKDEIGKYNPDVLGVSCMFTSVTEISIEICRISKECKTKYTIVGGPTPSALPGFFLSESYVDIVFIGESEKSILDFVQAIEKKENPDFTDIDGIVYKDSHGDIVSQPKKYFIANLDEIPFPARYLLPVEKYFKFTSPQGGVYKSKRNTPIMTSRGCPAKCCFCSSTNIWGNKYRYRSPENVIKELEILKSEYKIKEFQIQDDNFTFNKKRTIEICNGLKGLGLHWSMPNGVAVWALDEDIIKAMSESGCHYVIAAIESGNQRVLKYVIKKPLNLDKVVDICNYITSHKIRLSGFFIVGFPDETLEEIKDTFNFALKCNLHIANFNYATPLPGTRLWEQAEKENLFVSKFDMANIIYDRPSLKSKNWTIQDLESLYLSESRKFYLRTFIKHPKVILFRAVDSFRKNPVNLFKIIYYRMIGR